MLNKKVAILGAGNVGQALASGWAKSGTQLRFGVRDPEARNSDLYLSLAEAARWGDIIVLATPWSATLGLLGSLEGLKEKLLVDCTNPIAFEDGRLKFIDLGGASGGALIAEASGASVVKTLNQVGANILRTAHEFSPSPPMFLAGEEDAKAEVTPLVEQLGFEALDAGPIENAATLERFAYLWIDQAARGPRGRDFVFSIATTAASE